MAMALWINSKRNYCNWYVQLLRQIVDQNVGENRIQLILLQQKRERNSVSNKGQQKTTTSRTVKTDVKTERKMPTLRTSAASSNSLYQQSPIAKPKIEVTGPPRQQTQKVIKGLAPLNLNFMY